MAGLAAFLGAVSDLHLKQLCKTLWSWPTCAQCKIGKSCMDLACPYKRCGRLSSFFEHYRRHTTAYAPDVSHGHRPALQSHEAFLKMIEVLKSSSDKTPAQLIDRFLDLNRDQHLISPEDSRQVLNLAMRIVYMVNCSAQQHSSALIELGAIQRHWQNDYTLCQFMTESFHTSDHPDLNDANVAASDSMRRALIAKKLKKRLGIRFLPTDNLRAHLRYDRKTQAVEIFHHTAFLREHLRMTRNCADAGSMGGALKRGTLPRQLALEVLDSIQKVLFPVSDAKSRSMLKSLVSTMSFDPDCLRVESTSIRNDDEEEIAYLYFGARMAELYEELKNPSPRGGLEKWIQRRSSARHAMFATLIGVLIAVLLGIAALAVSIYQAYVGYQAWQHPVNPGINS